MAADAFIYDAARTPRGRGKSTGSLHCVKPVTLATGLVDAVRKRLPTLDVDRVDDVILGVVTPVGDQGANLAKTVALVAGLAHTTGGLQVNRFCGSGLEAVNLAAQKVRSGWAHLVIAGGVESMSRVPMGSDGGAWALDPETNHDAFFVPQGISADLIATLEGFSREDVDAYALRSQQRAALAWTEHRFDGSIVPVVDRNGRTLLDRDEHPRPATTLADLAQLSPSFASLGEAAGFDAVALQKYHWLERLEHVHTAGNSSGIVDGAALVVVGSEAVGEAMGLKPRARIAAAATSGADPTLMLTGPTPATLNALRQARLGVDDIDLFEINEAFAAVVLKYMKDLNLPAEKVNVNGGAIALGHPLGATGAMLVGTVLDELERRQGRRAVVTLCIGGGMGIATVIERV